MYSDKDKKVKLFNHSPAFNPGAKITSLQETKDGKLWLVYQNGFFQDYDIKSDKIIFSATALQKLNRENIQSTYQGRCCPSFNHNA